MSKIAEYFYPHLYYQPCGVNREVPPDEPECSHQIVTIEKIKEKDYLICQDCKHDVTGEIIG